MVGSVPPVRAESRAMLAVTGGVDELVAAGVDCSTIAAPLPEAADDEPVLPRAGGFP